jgi:DNA-binding response OmpR family regulator
MCAHSLEERPGIKVLVMSGEEMNQIASQDANMPLLPKPFDGETLKAKVRTILARSSSAADPSSDPDRA